MRMGTGLEGCVAGRQGELRLEKLRPKSCETRDDEPLGRRRAIEQHEWLIDYEVQRRTRDVAYLVGPPRASDEFGPFLSLMMVESPVDIFCIWRKRGKEDGRLLKFKHIIEISLF